MIRTLTSSLFGAKLRRLLLLKKAILSSGLIVPLTAANAIEQAQAAVDAGATVLEVYLRASSEETFDADIAAALEAIRTLKERFGDRTFIGAGSADQPWLAALAIEAGADFIISQGFVPDTMRLCAAHGVLAILGCGDAASISQHIELAEQCYRFELDSAEYEQLGITRTEARAEIVKFFNATGRMLEFSGIAATHTGRNVHFLIAGGVTVAEPTYHVDSSTITSDQSVASWSSRPGVGAVTSSAMMKGSADEVQAGLRCALEQVKFGRGNGPATKS